MQDEHDKQTDDMFPALGTDAAPEQQDEGQAEFLPGFKTREEAVAAVEAMRRSEDELKAAREREAANQQLLEQLLMAQAGGPQHQPIQSPRPEVNYDALPDPVEDRAGFARALHAQMEAQKEWDRQAAEQQAAPGRQLDELWSTFQGAYPDLAEYEEFVGVAAKAEMDRIRGRGVDPYRAIAINPDGFMRRVAERTKERVDGLKAKLAPPAPDRPPNRDVGLGGGTHPAAPNASGEGKDAFGSLVGDLANIQRTSGFF